MFEKCPCGAGASYLTCCAPLHLGQRAAASPEQLMRSRYSAFARRDAAYLLTSWAPETRPPGVGDLSGQEWLGLTVHDAPPPEGDVGFVEFSAKLREGGRNATIRERSRFRREDGRWFYVGEA